MKPTPPPYPEIPVHIEPPPTRKPQKIVIAQEENRCVTMSDWTAFRLGFCFAYGWFAAVGSIALIGGLLAIIVVLIMGMGIAAAT